MSNYYDGTKLLSQLDINGNKPEIYMCTSNRSAGKTTYFGRYTVNRFLKYNEKFILLYRFNYELDSCADKFYKDLSTLYYGGMVMTNQRRASGLYHELFLEDKPCGYALALNGADQLKKYSHFFSDTSRMIFDEFQSETGHYCDKEVQKFISVHTTVARGQGKQVRYVPVYMLSNPVTLLNPYYVSMEISSRIKNDTKFLRGEGFVLEQGFNESASLAQSESGFNKAFANESYVGYSTQAVYLNDNKSFVEKPTGRCRYLATLRYMNKDYALKEYADSGFIYVDDKPDTTFRFKISVTTDDHQINYVMLKRNDIFISQLRFYFEKGCFRFKNLQCKDILLKALSY